MGGVPYIVRFQRFQQAREETESYGNIKTLEAFLLEIYGNRALFSLNIYIYREKIEGFLFENVYME